MIDSTAVKGVVVALLLKLCTKVVENQFDLMDPRLFRLDLNSSTNATSQNEICYYAGRTDVGISQKSATSWIFAFRYLFLALGGLMSSACLDYIRVIQVGGVTMLLSTVLMSIMVTTGLMCQPSSPLVIPTWLLLPLFLGLTQSSLVHVMFQWHRRRKLSTVVSSLYYIVAVLGEVLSEFISQLLHPSSLGNKCTLIYVAFGVAFTTLTMLVPRNPNEEQFEMPTQRRMRSYFQIFSALILFLVSVSDMRTVLYMAELNFYLNKTQPFGADSSWLSISRMYLLSMIATSIILLLVAALKPRQLVVKPRILSGILLKSGVAVGLMIFSLIGTATASSAIIMYSVASVADGIAEVLTVVASYDLTQRIVPRSSMNFLLGVMFAVWGLANIASRLIVLLIEPGLHPSDNEKPKFYIYHLVILLILVLCACYHKFLALPLARQLTPTEDDEESADSVATARGQELKPLLEPINN